MASPSNRVSDPSSESKMTALAPAGRSPTLAEFRRIVGSRNLIRLGPDTQILVPAGGPSAPVAPTLFGEVKNRAANGELANWSATTKNSYYNGRTPDGEPTACVTLSSVAQEANAMEMALLEAKHDGIDIPDLIVDFTQDSRTKYLGRIGTLQAPHRGYDALLRDSLLNNAILGETSIGHALTSASVKFATPLLMLPHMLLFGAWHSQGAGGGSGTKIGRAMKSEIIGFGAVPADIASSRIDPTGIKSSEELRIYKARAEAQSSDPLANSPRRPYLGWETDPNFAEVDKAGKPVLFTSKKRESGTTPGTAALLNHSNVKPSARSGRATITGAVHVMELSLTALRNLTFPAEAGGEVSQNRNLAARTALAALAMVAMTQRLAAGYHLRSGCDLVALKSPRFEIVGASLEETEVLDIDPSGARSLLVEAVAACVAEGLAWGLPAGTGPLVPSPQLVEAISASMGIIEDEAVS